MPTLAVEGGHYCNSIFSEMAARVALRLLTLAAAACAVLGLVHPDMAAAHLKWKPVPAAQVLSATNFHDEVDYWRRLGNPLFLNFESDVGTPELISVRNTLPMISSIDDVDQFVKFHLFTKQDENDMLGKEFFIDGSQMPEMFFRTKLMEMGFNPSMPTKFIVHDFGKNIKSKDVMMIKNAYLKRGDVNVVLVDWSALSKSPDYYMARLHVAPVGVRVGKMMDFVTRSSGDMAAKRTHVIGMGLGAHIAGVAGKTLEHGPIFRITALDPARPLFERTSRLGQLHRSDAALVDAIHTNAGGLGVMEPVGQLDFYPNGGKYQPGCGWDVFGGCAHSRAAMYFSESIEDPSKFKSVSCRVIEDAVKEECHSQIFSVMGEGNDFKNHGIYYVKTNEKAPFSL